MQMHPDDDAFESYLRQFRPRAPEALRGATGARKMRRAVALGSWAAAAAFVLSTALLTTNHRPSSNHAAGDAEDLRIEPASVNSRPLTIAKADSLLAHAPSLKAVVDQMAFRPRSTELPKNQQSMLAVLSQEKN